MLRVCVDAVFVRFWIFFIGLGSRLAPIISDLAMTALILPAIYHLLRRIMTTTPCLGSILYLGCEDLSTKALEERWRMRAHAIIYYQLTNSWAMQIV